MMNQDYDSAEKHMKKSLDLGSAMPEAEGANKLQLGMMAMQKGDMKTGESYVRQAIRAGIPDRIYNFLNFLHIALLHWLLNQA